MDRKVWKDALEKVEKILGKNFSGGTFVERHCGGYYAYLLELTNTEGLHFKVGWDGVSPVGISLFDVEAKTISFQGDGGKPLRLI